MSEDGWEAERARLNRIIAARELFVDAAKAEFDAKRIFVRSRDRCQSAIHKSAYPGVAIQLSSWSDGEPWGHTAHPNFEEAARDMWSYHLAEEERDSWLLRQGDGPGVDLGDRLDVAVVEVATQATKVQ